MALQTRGFSVSQSPRAPAIPRNIGSVDVNEIVAGVKRGLEGFEAVRRAPKSMILADAQMDTATAEAPLGTRRLTAETLATEQQLPYKTAILAEEASPEMMAARRTALLARAAPKPLTGVPYLLERAAQLERAVQENPNDPVLSEALNQTRLQLSQARDVAAGKNATAQNIAEGKNATVLDVTGQTLQSKEGIAAADRDARVAMQAAELKSREAINASQQTYKAARDTAKTDQERAAVGAKARTALAIGEERNKLFNETVGRTITNLAGAPDAVVTDSRIPGGNIAGAIARVIGSFIPGSNSSDLESLVETLKSEVGFKELEAMRAAAPGNTGASGLGQVTEKEIAYLQNRLANLKFSQSDKQLYDNIKVFQDAVNTAWRNAKAAYEFDYGPRTVGTATPPGAVTPSPAAALVGRTFASESEAEAAGDRGEIEPGAVISVGGKQFKWTP